MINSSGSLEAGSEKIELKTIVSSFGTKFPVEINGMHSNTFEISELDISDEKGGML